MLVSFENNARMLADLFALFRDQDNPVPLRSICPILASPIISRPSVVTDICFSQSFCHSTSHHLFRTSCPSWSCRDRSTTNLLPFLLLRALYHGIKTVLTPALVEAPVIDHYHTMELCHSPNNEKASSSHVHDQGCIIKLTLEFVGAGMLFGLNASWRFRACCLIVTIQVTVTNLVHSWWFYPRMGD